ncbi:peroxide stress protein YaaA [Pectinatus haikarae]|uniref:peroxide stress protein YaaA n=1 Tax=Pectinatus haikarae TaxID=349096 RepID=UPI0018C620C2|nr:peroxide stress protein YaaA [Pectinatus haikarae]
MKIIISPAKKMNTATDDFLPAGLPVFIAETAKLLDILKTMDYTAVKKLWHCSDAIATMNYERLQTMDLYRNLTPAVLAYEGIQYMHMAPGIFEYSQLEYIKKHLYILSGFYGLLRSFDGIVPYRLEMQARFPAMPFKNLYSFWNDKISSVLCSDKELILNLASKEYSRVVTDHLPSSARFLTCTFGEMKADRVVEKGTMCKIARGEMVRWLAENKVADFQSIKEFAIFGYSYNNMYSTENNFVFIRNNPVVL